MAREHQTKVLRVCIEIVPSKISSIEKTLPCRNLDQITFQKSSVALKISFSQKNEYHQIFYIGRNSQIVVLTCFRRKCISPCWGSSVSRTWICRAGRRRCRPAASDRRSTAGCRPGPG